ncbi:hydroxyethylthiazole kinase [Desulfovibrio mangrovi]|uniref:hydroxyethylthiazole kinase n=1 Tax=Desulfovibrio mangrovi TaxID=2976983 RepID=UPI0022484853|nr:hydroxyethylthiazole kinase [Desulfovibrio mangrovi]UZP68886.1 hydroxyethylthiazole kinase [Desulfovibrio mangrovi]
MDFKTIWQQVCKVRKQRPLVHNITNYVVMNTTANALLSAGASPIMAHAPEEMEQLVGIAGSLVLNIGTLSAPWIQSMLQAGQYASKRHIPVVLDPVGAGASNLRTDTAMRLLHAAKPAVVRGNGSEIMALHGAGGMTKGVDSILQSSDAHEAAVELSRQYDCVVAVTGEEDIVIKGTCAYRIKGGSPLMARVTGMGCTATALIGAYVAVSESPFEGAVSALAVMAAAGGMAGRKAAGPGSFQMHFYDALYAMTMEDIEALVDVCECDCPELGYGDSEQ